MPTTDTEALLTFFKALSDLNRLRIVGLLATEPHTVERLAAALDLSDGTVSHHLRRLARAGLVEARAEGYYRLYTLRIDTLHEMAGRLLGDDRLPMLADDVDVDAFDRKVLSTFSDAGGRFKTFPSQEKKYLVLVRHAARSFGGAALQREAGQRHPGAPARGHRAPPA